MSEGREPIQPKPDAPKIPGGPYRPRPVVMEGKTYDGMHPPKLVRREDGSIGAVGGREVDKDADYAERFWRRQPPGMREVMVKIVHASAANSGTIGSFVDPSGITEMDREKLSAYRQLAEELGYEVGEYAFNNQTYTAMAPIRKKSK